MKTTLPQFKRGDIVRYRLPLDIYTYTVLEVNPPNPTDADKRVRLSIALREWEGIFRPQYVVHETEVMPVGRPYIATVEEAKAFLKALHTNGESYHPEDDASTIINGHAQTLVSVPCPQELLFSPEEAAVLNHIMNDIYRLPGNFDPCAYLVDLLNGTADDINSPVDIQIKIVGQGTRAQIIAALDDIAGELKTMKDCQICGLVTYEHSVLLADFSPGRG